MVVVVAACDPPRATPVPDAPPVDAPPGVCIKGELALAVTTLAGCELPDITDGIRADARFNNPTNVAIGPDGTAYVTDFDNNRVRRVAPDGQTTTLIDDATRFARPFGITFAPDGALLIETDDNDTLEHTIDTGTIWRVDPTTGDATVLARNLGRPRGIVALADGRIVMSDHMHHVISILDPATGIETTLAGMPDVAGYANGTGTEARFAQPYDIVQLPDGDLAVADQDNHRIRRVTLAGVVTDLAGSGAVSNIDGPVGVATFHAPQGLALAGDTLFVTDVRRYFIRRISNGNVVTVAGDGTQGWLDSDSPRGARFYGIEGLDADGTRLVVADGNGGFGTPFHRIRTIRLDAIAD